jgi:hypothetical protein
VVVADDWGAHVVMDVTGYFIKANKAEFRSFIEESTANPGAAIGGTCSNIGQITVTVPVVGAVEVTARGTLSIAHTAGIIDRVDMGIGETAGDCTFSETASVMVSDALPTGNHFPADTVFALFNDVIPGTKTFYLNATRVAGSGAASLVSGSIKARVYPN